MNLKIVLFSLVAIAMASCNTTRVVKPLEKGEWQIGANYGGPYVNNGMLPLSGINVAHGLKENLSLFGGIHTTTLAFQTLQLDLGLNYGLFVNDGLKPGLSINGVLNPAISLRNGAFRLYLEITPNLYWELKQAKSSQIIHLGLSNWIDPWAGAFEYGNGGWYNPAMNLGFRYTRKRLMVSAEFKWLNFNQKLKVPQAKVNSIGEKGCYGLYAGVSYRFNHLNRKNDE